MTAVIGLRHSRGYINSQSLYASMMQAQASATRLSANYVLHIVLPAERCSLLGLTILTERIYSEY